MRSETAEGQIQVGAPSRAVLRTRAEDPNRAVRDAHTENVEHNPGFVRGDRDPWPPGSLS